MRFHENTETGEHRYEVTVSMPKDIAVKFLMLKALDQIEGNFTYESWMICQMIARSFNRNKTDKRFKEALESGDKCKSEVCKAALRAMDALRAPGSAGSAGIRPPAYAAVDAGTEASRTP